MEGLVPDHIPEWLTNMVKKSKGRNLEDFNGLDDFHKETDVVIANKYDRSFYGSMREASPDLADLANSRWVDDRSFGDLVQDEYLAFYKHQPKIRKPNEMKPTHLINHAVLGKAQNTRDWQELRLITELDEWASAMAATTFGQKLKDLFDEHKELMSVQNDMNGANQEVQKAIDKLNELDGKGPGSEQEAEEWLDNLQDALRGFQEASEGVEQAIEAHGSQLRAMAREAASETKDDASKVEELLEAFGTEPGALKRMDAQARMELAQRIRRNKKLKELAEKVGRFVRLALGEQARKVIHGVDEIHDVELGADPHRLLPSELIYLAEEGLEDLFYKKFAEKELLQYQLRGNEKVARGAIICMIDSSGSMYGAKETWAKAVGIALLNIAKLQGRDFYGIIFSSARDKLLEWYFKKGSASIDDVLDFAEFAYHGGTDFEKPLNRAVEVLQKQFNDDDAQKGDLVMITDGECYVSPEWLDRWNNAKHDLAFRLYSALIGVNSNTLAAISDQIYHINELAQGNDLKEVFGFV
jgi:uncharacterized protein with von Willebrand factor type A (vWA) domain